MRHGAAIATMLVLTLGLAGCGAPAAKGPAADGSAGKAGGASPRASTGQTATLEQQDASTDESASAGSGDFCEAVEAFNRVPDSDTMNDAERTEAIGIIDGLLAMWPASTRSAADIYFGELRDVLVAGDAVDLDNSSEGFKEAFATVFTVAADACSGGFG
ncbi:hypothetical protein [Parafrigoribacterium humi]|uniref:hypothetical protein n=1 Tax=Parafrigoribacterium humi TaxID=3144664 RepID=UPI0032ECDD39